MSWCKETQNVWLFSGYFWREGGELVTLADLRMQIFLSIRKSFLHLFWLYLLHCLLEACLTLSFMMETQRVRHPFHFSPNIFSLCCQFYILKILVNILCFIREKSYWISTLISLSKLMRKILEDRFSSGERIALWSSFMDVCCTTWEGGSEWNRMLVDAKGGGEDGIFNFFADIINHLPIRSTSRMENFAGIKFCAMTLWSFVISPEFNIMYALSPKFLTATRMMSLKVILISWNRLDKNVTPH